LLEFARAERMSHPAELEVVNVAEAASMAARRESNGNADIRITVDSTFTVQANREYLVRALANILRNAVRYAGDRGPIEVSAAQKDGHVEISITDSGPGIPEEALDRVFMPFYRLDEARDRRTGGTGLGLAIVRTCIEA